MSKYINPFSDWGFKTIFGQTANKDLLIDFLNNLLTGEQEIEDITFLDKELLGEIRSDRSVIYDIYCTTKNGEHIIVEMQNRAQEYFRERALFYLSRAIVRQGKKGEEWQFKLKAVYGVFFMNFLPEGMAHKLRTDIVLADRETHEPFLDKLRFIFIELPAFQKKAEECETDFERWIYILKNMETSPKELLFARNPIFRKLAAITDISALPEEERDKYENSIDIFRDNLAVMAAARNEGEREGIAKGMAKGKAEGKAEKQREIVLRMQEMGLPIETICQATGLSEEEIKGGSRLDRE